MLQYSWNPSKAYIKAASWIVMINLISVSNDAVAKCLGENLHPFQIAFLRFLVTLLTVLPFMQGKHLFRTKMPAFHFWRTFLGTAAIALNIYSVLKFQIVCNTSIMFAEPVLLLPLAAVFLKERISGPRWICTLIGLFGIFVVLYRDVLSFNAWFFVPLMSAFLFASISILAKKMISQKEPIVTSLFYFALGTTVLSAIPAMMVWQPLTGFQIAIVALLGINANLMQVCMFKAFDLAEASSLMPFRYLEFVFSWIVGFVLFHQSPSWNVFVGCALIILSSVLITLSEKKAFLRREKL